MLFGTCYYGMCYRPGIRPLQRADRSPTTTFPSSSCRLEILYFRHHWICLCEPNFQPGQTVRSLTEGEESWAGGSRDSECRFKHFGKLL